MMIKSFLLAIFIASTVVSGIGTNNGTVLATAPSTTTLLNSKSTIILAAADNLYFGESYYADRQEFHSKIKKKILADAGDFQKKIGSNPDISVSKKKIVLTGTGDFKGKSFPTELSADTYLLK